MEDIIPLTGNPHQITQARASLKAICNALVQASKNYGNPFTMDYRRIADDVGLSHQKCGKWLDRLEEAQLISIRRGVRNTSSCITLYDGVPLSIYSNKSEGATEYGCQGVYNLKKVEQTKEESHLVNVNSSSVSLFNSSSCKLPGTHEVSAQYITYGTPSSYTGLLSDLPDFILSDSDKIKLNQPDPLMVILDSLHPVSSKEKKAQKRAEDLERKSRLGEAFQNMLWSQIQTELKSGGRYTYPIHPDVYHLLKHQEVRLAKAIDDEYAYYATKHPTMVYEGYKDKLIAPKVTQRMEEEFNLEFAKFYADGRLLKQYQNLFQVSLATRRRCPNCNNALRKYLVQNGKFGAIRMRCQKCSRMKKHCMFDIWPQYPVFVSSQSGGKKLNFECEAQGG